MTKKCGQQNKSRINKITKKVLIVWIMLTLNVYIVIVVVGIKPSILPLFPPSFVGRPSKVLNPR